MKTRIERSVVVLWLAGTAALLAQVAPAPPPPPDVPAIDELDVPPVPPAPPALAIASTAPPAAPAPPSPPAFAIAAPAPPALPTSPAPQVAPAPPAPPAPPAAWQDPVDQLDVVAPAPPALPTSPAPQFDILAPPAPPDDWLDRVNDLAIAAPTPAQAPSPAPAPQVAPAPPAPPAPPADWQMFPDDWQDRVNDLAQQAADKALAAQDKLKDIEDKVWEAQQKAFDKADNFALAGKPFNFNFDFDLKTLPFTLQTVRTAKVFQFGGNADGLYERGRRELDSRNWDQAVNDFGEVARRGGARADGALYWKAYALNKLGRRDEALAAIAELRKSYTSSRWLDDANALEVEVKQSSGGTVAPDSTNDDDIKLLALNGLMQSDPDRAYPYLEKLLKSATSPRLKEQTLYVLAQSNSPKAQQALLGIAKGGGNPDLQVTAIRYLAAVNRRGRGNEPANADNLKTLFDIYNSSTDITVKREVLNALSSARDKDHLAEIARNEKNHDLQMDAIRRLGGSQEGAGDLLVSIYNATPDKDARREVVNVLAGSRNAKALVDLGRKEKDLEMKKYIVERVMGMNTPESRQFLEEILK